MNPVTRSALGRGLLVLITIFAGCELSRPKPAPGLIEIENVAKWFHLYRTRNRGKAPKDEAEFIEFMNAELAGRGEEIDWDELLTSPRDNQKFIVRYGTKAESRNFEKNIACYEAEGYDGKKLVGFESGWSREVEGAELEGLLSGGE